MIIAPKIEVRLIILADKYVIVKKLSRAFEGLRLGK
jgi:hypothetical protein